MSKVKNYLSPVTILSKTLKLEGDLNSESDVRIEGELIGSVATLGKVVIDRSGIVKGNLSCKDLEMHGVVEGLISVDEHAFFGQYSKFEGRVESNSIEIQTGASFFGKINSSEGKSKDSNFNEEFEELSKSHIPKSVIIDIKQRVSSHTNKTLNGKNENTIPDLFKNQSGEVW